MNIRLLPLFAIPLTALIGCQSTSQQSAPVPKSAQHTQPPPRAAALHRGAITRKQAFQNVVRHSPRIQSLEAEIRARQAEAYQATLPPNPSFEFEAENFGGTGETNGFSGAELTTGLSQEIQLGGKRRKRTRVAQLEADSLQAELSRVKLSLQIATDQKFVDLLEVLGTDDPRTAEWRRKLSTALF